MKFLVALGMVMWCLITPLILAGICINTADAHVLGNNTVNRQAWLHLTPTVLELRYLMDIAEIPTLVQTRNADTNQDGDTSDQEWNAHVSRWAEQLRVQLRLEMNGKPVSLKLDSQKYALELGDIALNTLRLEAWFSVALSGQEQSVALRYEDASMPGQLGWKEIWLDAAPGLSIAGAERMRRDRSRGLTEYTLPQGQQPPDELGAEAAFEFASAPRADLTPAPAVISEAGQSSTDNAQANTDTDLRPPQSRDWFTQDVVPFFRLGMHHIATGWDHLLFLFGLLLLLQPLGTLIKVVTAFTLAHSLTLGLAASGVVTAPGAWVEPAIALTIAYVGLLNLVWRQTRHGIWLAFGFGLIHGFGFAGALASSLSELSPGNGNWLLSLASFNLGIETIQIVLVCLVVPILRYAMRFSWYRMAQTAASCAVIVLGLNWFFARTLGY